MAPVPTPLQPAGTAARPKPYLEQSASHACKSRSLTSVQGWQLHLGSGRAGTQHQSCTSRQAEQHARRLALRPLLRPLHCCCSNGRAWGNGSQAGEATAGMSMQTSRQSMTQHVKQRLTALADTPCP